eukprot:CAMPEP_0195122598 /NCGR_PEP_ID=MMETSP0448-20130528/126763_1 /TAXON_ID=66468 /ORGANISM="Heterocapsa triquestra, Strain CCMP 448" /LENGTH=133 /DNA_ID=CAMNT_0040160099 /DNA_START=3 /DNA_END=401 /DNA_ORIENTATION=+
MSSFYLSLNAPGCRGTCLILDEHVQPLARSWCLFEFLQTIKRKESAINQADHFQGLYFCTSSGVVNTGEASVEVVLNIGKELSRLRLENAKASAIQDKAMIDGLVVSELGSFAAINNKLRSYTMDALIACQQA